MSTQQPQLNSDQRKAHAEISNWLDSDSLEHRLVGAAGTGKTFVLRSLVPNFGIGWVYGAPTNKATKELRRVLTPHGVTSFATIYSTLGLKMTQHEDRLELDRPRPVDLSAIAGIVLDEAGMSNTQLLGYIHEAQRNYNVKFLYVGDDYQLTPVGEDSSPVFDIQCSQSRLDKVERHDNQILALATKVRTRIKEQDWSALDLVSDNDRREGVWVDDAGSMIERIGKHASRELFSGLEPKSVAIAWRNRTVDYLNSVVRGKIFTKKELASSKWLPGDRIVVTAPVQVPISDAYKEYTTIANTDDTGVVKSVNVTSHPLYPEFRIYALAIDLDTGGSITIMCVHETSTDAVMNRLQLLASDARSGKGYLWKEFWKLKEAFHSIRYGYALTSHRAQGSTYQYVFVDAHDILSNRNREESFRSLYVAYSRPSARLYTSG